MISIEVNDESKKLICTKKVKKMLNNVIADICLHSFQGGQEDVNTGFTKLSMAKLSEGGPAV